MERYQILLLGFVSLFNYNNSINPLTHLPVRHACKKSLLVLLLKTFVKTDFKLRYSLCFIAETFRLYKAKNLVRKK